MKHLQPKMYAVLHLLLKMYSGKVGKWASITIVLSCLSSTIYGQDLVVSGNNPTINGTWDNITVQNGGVGTLNGNVIANVNVVVQNGGVLDLANFTLTAAGTITIDDGGIVLESNATTGFGSSVVTVVRNLTTDLVYRYVSSPVNAGSIIGSTMYRYNEAGRTAGDFTTGWVSFSGAMTKGKGYAGYRPSAGSPSTANYTGVLTSGNISPAITHTNTDNDNTLDGWNLLGNPYPSPVDITAFLADNPASIDGGAVYFWNGINYTTKNSGNIPVGQGFFAHCAASGTADFHNSQRVSTGGNVQYRVATGIAFLELQLNSTHNLDVTKIQFNDNATDDFETHFDAIKLKTTTANELYTFVGTRATAIDMLKKDGKDKTIPLGINVADVNGLTFSISNNALEGYDQVLLTDKDTKITTDLLKSSYSFAAAKGSYDSRFELKLVGAKTAVVTGLGPDQRPEIKIMRSAISINTNGNESAVLVMDMMGRTLHSGTHSGEVTVPVYTSGVYLVRVQNKDGILAKKYLVTDH